MRGRAPGPAPARAPDHGTFGTAGAFGIVTLGAAGADGCGVRNRKKTRASVSTTTTLMITISPIGRVRLAGATGAWDAAGVGATGGTTGGGASRIMRVKSLGGR